MGNSLPGGGGSGTLPKRALRRFTLKDLRVFDGTNHRPIFVSVNDRVFDVTSQE